MKRGFRSSKDRLGLRLLNLHKVQILGLAMLMADPALACMPVVDLYRIRLDPNLSLSHFIGPWVIGAVVIVKALGLIRLYPDRIKSILKLMATVVLANLLTSILGVLNGAFTAAHHVGIYLFVGIPIYGVVGFWVGKRLQLLANEQPDFWKGWHLITKTLVNRPWAWAVIFPFIQALSFFLFFYVLSRDVSKFDLEYLWFKWLAVLFSIGSGYVVTSLIEAEVIWKLTRLMKLQSVIDGGHVRLIQGVFRVNAFAIIAVLLVAVALKVWRAGAPL